MSKNKILKKFSQGKFLCYKKGMLGKVYMVQIEAFAFRNSCFSKVLYENQRNSPNFDKLAG